MDTAEHQHDGSENSRALAVAVGLNVVITWAEALIGLLSGSLALIADALHNLSDVGGLVFAWIGSRLTRRDPTSTRTFGLLRAEPLVAFVNALVLLVLAGSPVWAGLHRLDATSAPSGAVVFETKPLLQRLQQTLRAAHGVGHPTLQLEPAACESCGVLGDPRLHQVPP